MCACCNGSGRRARTIRDRFNSLLPFRRYVRTVALSTHGEVGLRCGTTFKTEFRDGGIVGGYRACLTSRADIDWSQCPADLEIIEQVVLARNRDQHPESITSVRVTHTEKDRQRFPRPFFMSEREAALFEEGDEQALFMLLSVHVSSDNDDRDRAGGAPLRMARREATQC